MAPVHVYTVDLMIDAGDRDHILRHHLARLHAASLRQNNNAGGQRIYLRTDTCRPVRARQIIIVHLVINPCLRRPLDAGQLFLPLQKCDVHHIPGLNLGDRHGAVVFILHIGCSVIIESILLSRIHIDKRHRFVVRIGGQDNRCIRGIIASHSGKRKACVHHIRFAVLVLGFSYVAGLRSTSCQNECRQCQHRNSSGNSSVYSDHFCLHSEIFHAEERGRNLPFRSAIKGICEASAQIPTELVQFVA